ncbi:MAG TPA: hypothetical protein VMF58_08100 [Rhizomicrobium sp.]|nr:hypothetical protein [Rhizomicrobium sp.]
MAGTALPTETFQKTAPGSFGRQKLVQLAGRYSLSAIGPIATSGAHFAASLIFLHRMEQAEFGLFSFLLVVVPFGLSISSGLLCAPLVSAINKPGTVGEGERAAFRAVNRVYSLIVGLVTAVLMYTSKAGDVSSVLLGFYGAAMTMRWFSRSNAYYLSHPLRASASDLVYSLSLVGGLVLLIAIGHLTMEFASAVLMTSALLGLLPFGWEFLRLQLLPIEKKAFRLYGPIWRDITRWSLMGVALSEITANAHAYVVTFFAGAQAFAVLAAGALLMRPLMLVLTALPDRERPVMGRALAAGDIESAFATRNEFRIASAVAWLGTVLLSAGILIWFPQLIVRTGFDHREVEVVVAIWALIVAVRTARTADATFLQAACEFNGLARAGLPAGIASLAMTLALLLTLGPVASLGGILAGELVTTVNIFALMRKWKRDHA